ncbi:MAG TPA: hypothetical protein VMS17_23035 [Gemmataceae bacterium]|nr:hypothetical protein [Gemmataceae bacterium]
MNWLRKMLSVRASTRKQTPRPSVAPRLEALETRLTPTVSYYGGNLLPNVQVQGVYYGDQWSANPTLFQETGKFEGYLQYLVNSPFMDMLTKAGYDVGRGSSTQGRILNISLSSGNYLEDSTIQSNLKAEIAAGALQAPNADTLYVVYVEPNVAVQQSGGDTSINKFAGYHGAFTGPNGSVIRYAVLPTPGGSTVGGAPNGSANPSLNAFDEMTMASSHEIAEAVTDPDVNYSTLGWYDQQRGEIGDIANGQVVYLNSYAVQKIGGKNDQALFPTELTVRGVSFNATAGQTFSGEVAVGGDSAGLTQAGNLQATINWGDGTTTTGSVSVDGSGNFIVSGAHTYSSSGNFTVGVSLQDRTNTIGYATESATESVQQPTGGGGGGGGGGGSSGAYLVSEITGDGVWRYSAATGWQQLTGANATEVAVDSRGDVVAEFNGYGLWRYEDATGWRQLTGADAALVGIADNGTVAAEFNGYGVWRFEDAAGWQLLTGANASELSVAGAGIVAANFYGYGLWRFEDATGWQQLTGANASQIAVDANGDVAASFYGYGVWRFENATGWQQLSSAYASQLSIAGDGIVAADLNGYGVERFEDSTGWEGLTGADASKVSVDAAGDVAGAFGNGVWLYEDGLGWGQLTAATALDLGLGN